MTAVRQLRPKPAKAPQRRTVRVAIETGEYEGWECTAYADFKAKGLAAFQSDDVTQILAFLDRNIIEHNFPDAEDPDVLAESLGDVEQGAIKVIAGALFDAIGKLPNR